MKLYVANLLLVNKIVTERDGTIEKERSEIGEMKAERAELKEQIKEALTSNQNKTYADAAEVSKNDDSSNAANNSKLLNLTDSGICNDIHSLT